MLYESVPCTGSFAFACAGVRFRRNDATQWRDEESRRNASEPRRRRLRVAFLEGLASFHAPASRFITMYFLFVVCWAVSVLKVELETKRLFETFVPYIQRRAMHLASATTKNKKEDVRCLESLKQNSISDNFEKIGNHGNHGKSNLPIRTDSTKFRWNFPTNVHRVVHGHTIRGSNKHSSDDIQHNSNSRGFYPYTFAVMANPQIGFSRRRALELQCLRSVVDHINTIKPSYLVVVGNVAHQPVASSNDFLRTREILEFNDVMSSLDSSISLHVAGGSRDVGLPPTAETLQSYEEIFGDSYYSFWHENVLNIVLNSSLIFDVSDSQHFEKQHAWLEGVLDDAMLRGAAQMFLFSHRPLVLHVDDVHALLDVDEGHYSEHSVLCWRQRRLLQLLERYGVKHSFHSAPNVNDLIGNGKVASLIQIGTPPVIARNPLLGLRVVKVSSAGVEHNFSELM